MGGGGLAAVGRGDTRDRGRAWTRGKSAGRGRLRRGVTHTPPPRAWVVEMRGHSLGRHDRGVAGQTQPRRSSPPTPDGAQHQREPPPQPGRAVTHDVPNRHHTITCARLPLLPVLAAIETTGTWRARPPTHRAPHPSSPFPSPIPPVQPWGLGSPPAPHHREGQGTMGTAHHIWPLQ